MLFSPASDISPQNDIRKDKDGCALSTAVAAPGKVLQHNTGSAQEITIALEAQELPELAKHEDSSTCWDPPVLKFSLVIKVLSKPNPTHHAQCCPSPQRATGDTHSHPLGPVTYFNFPQKTVIFITGS